MKRLINVFFLLILVTIQVFSQAPANDNYANAIELSNLDNWNSLNKAYTTVGATKDGTRNGCQPIGPVNNVWFKFQATSQEVDIKLKTGGEFGSITHTSITLWSSNLSQIACNKFFMNYSISLQYISLTVGEWYYVSVDNQNGGAGTFSISINNEVGYDSWQKAYVLKDLNDWSSTNGEFSTINATPDRTKPSCMYVGTNNNVWFKFHATGTDIDVRLKRGGEEGSMGSSFLTLYNEAFQEVGCITYTSGQDLTIQNTNLTPGALYYIMVDNAGGEAGTFTLSITDKLDYDVKERAFEIESTSDWCSDLKQFDNINATRDGVKGSCWGNHPRSNVWFKFKAATQEIDIRIKTGGTEGTLSNALVALWDAANLELGCGIYQTGNSYNDAIIQKNGLVPGNWYYISVDGTLPGSFSLCINNELGNDIRSKAIVLSDVSNWCSSLEDFNNINASPDGVKGSCWGNYPKHNVWFKFVAIAPSIEIVLHSGGAEGTLTRPLMALWSLSGEIGCIRYPTNNEVADITIINNDLMTGEEYFISVDGSPGTFSICTRVPGLEKFFQIGDFKSNKTGEWNSNQTWKRYNGEWFLDVPQGDFPRENNSVFIEANHSIALGTNASCKDLHLNTTADVIRLNTGENTLDVYGKIRSYTGSVPGINSTSAGVPNWITTGTKGKLRLKGTSNRVITEKGEFSDHENLKGWTLECNLDEGVIGTINSNFRAGNVIITSGNLEVKSKNFKVSK